MYTSTRPHCSRPPRSNSIPPSQRHSSDVLLSIFIDSLNFFPKGICVNLGFPILLVQYWSGILASLFARFAESNFAHLMATRSHSFGSTRRIRRFSSGRKQDGVLAENRSVHHTLDVRISLFGVFLQPSGLQILQASPSSAPRLSLAENSRAVLGKKGTSLYSRYRWTSICPSSASRSTKSLYIFINLKCSENNVSFQPL